MGATTRKDYGSNAIVPENNEVVKRMNHVNTPHSIQATGTLRSGDYIESKNIAYGKIVVGDRVLVGNQEGVIKSVTTSGIDPDFVLETVTMDFNQEGKSAPRTETKTVAELKASGNYFFVKQA